MTTNAEIVELFHSNLTLTDVRKQTKVRYGTIRELWVEAFGEVAVKERKRLRYRNSKMGDNNPMKGRSLSKHPRWLSDESKLSDNRGYVRVRKQDWYTGRCDGQGYVSEHVQVYCESRGLTKVEDGFVIHHLDMDKKNNDPKNLIMLSNLDHIMLHSWITRVVVQRLSREGVGP